MPNIHSELVHVPGAARAAGKARKIRVQGPREKRFRQSVKTAFQNRTNTPGIRLKVKDGRSKQKNFGTVRGLEKENRSERRYGDLTSAVTGATIGTIGAGGYAVATDKTHKIAANREKLGKRWGAGKAHLITDVGTKGAKDFIPKKGRYTAVGLGSAGITGGGLGAGIHHQNKKDKKTLARQAQQLKEIGKRNMSDAELRRRQKLQAKIGRTTSTLGLTGLGMLGAGAAIKAKPGMLRAVPKYKGLAHETLKAKGEKLGGASTKVGVVSGGIGGLGGFNQASIYSAESRKRKTVVTKGISEEMGYYGEEGHQGVVEKAWSPVASSYDSEAKRHKRSSAYQAGALTAAGAGGAYGGVHAGKAVKAAKETKHAWQPKNMAESRTVQPKSYKSKGGKTVTPKARHVSVGHPEPAIPVGQASKFGQALKRTKVHSGKAAAGAAVAGAALGANALIRHKKEGSWASYQKRSAFGVDHGEVSKVGEWKTIDQRELSQRRSRKAMRTAGAGALIGGGLLYAGGKGGAKNVAGAAREARSGYKALRAFGGSRKVSAQATSRNISAHIARGTSQQQTQMALTAGGAGLVGGSVAAGTGAKGHHTYQQHKINQRRRANYNKVNKAINIKPENEGKFTASAKKAKHGVQEHAHAVVNSSKSTELQRKRAQFAINAKKWNH